METQSSPHPSRSFGNKNWTFFTRCQDVFQLVVDTEPDFCDKVSGTCLAVFVVTNLDIVDNTRYFWYKTSWHFLAKFGTLKLDFWRSCGTFSCGVFCNKIDIYDEASGCFQSCSWKQNQTFGTMSGQFPAVFVAAIWMFLIRLVDIYQLWFFQLNSWEQNQIFFYKMSGKSGCLKLSSR